MKLLTRMGDALLGRLAPEATATAVCGDCSAIEMGCGYKQNKCSGAYLYKRCCCTGSCANCSAGVCGPWQLCGAYC
ncbi:hypothetical protein ACFY7Y_00355 [Streptomyces virginiae]|uniref:hypothetical protein n=1 Tax=Streptomyces TaxID=1883 RepID=UPI0036CAB133